MANIAFNTTIRKQNKLVLFTLFFFTGMYIGNLSRNYQGVILDFGTFWDIIFACLLAYYAWVQAGFTSAQTEIAQSQEQLMRLQYQIYLRQNRPNVLYHHHDREMITIKNNGDLPAWHLSGNIFRLSNWAAEDRVRDIEWGRLDGGLEHPFSIPIEWRNDEGGLRLFIELTYYDSVERHEEYGTGKVITYLDMPFTQCPSCDSWVRENQGICDHCGHVFER